MSIKADINDAIDTSVEVLNALVPGWLDLMPTNLRRLDVMNAEACPLFYAFGDFQTGYCAVEAAGFGSMRLAFTSFWEWDDLSWQDRDVARDQLRVAWRTRIAELRD